MDEEAGKKLVLSKLRRTGGNVRAASRLLGVTDRQVKRYIVRLNLYAALSKIRDESGWNRKQMRSGVPLHVWRKRMRKRHPKHKPPPSAGCQPPVV